MKKILIVCLIFTFGNLYSQTTVTSLKALLPYLNDNNANVKLAPGTYSIDGDDVDDGIYGNPLLAFEGNNSTYDFTGVTLNIDTEVLSKFGNISVSLLQIFGNDNVLKNMKLVNIGNDAPQRDATTFVIDGEDNLLEGFHMTIRGSYPYGYGDAFGKGGNDVVIGHKKHCALLVRGESNHVKNCTVIHRSYGHAIFMQAANNPIIEGCYVEGEMRSTDDMLKERGTGSPADNVNFMTSWGYTLPAGYMMSTGEEGIRAYNGGTTYINGQTIQRGTSNPTVINCTVKHMRGGVTLAHATGTVRAENCTTIGCEQGYGLGSGTAINCKTDISHGHAFKSTYDNDSWNLDVEIIPAVDPYYNGQKCIAFIGMDKSDLKITGGDPNMPSDYKIQVGGKLDGVRFKNGSLENQSTHDGDNNELINQTMHPILIASGSSGNDIVSCSSVTNNGSNNDISQSNNCDVVTVAPTPVTPTTPVSSESGTLVTITKRSATGFNIDGSHNGEDGQNVQIWSANEDNVNQQWIEIDRGDGYYSYQKQGTDYCIDGNGGGASQQNIHLWTCATNNQNQHWQKVATDGGAFKLIKRNAPGYAINGGSAGVNGQNVNLYDSSNSSHNLQWFITPKVTIVHMKKRNATGFALDGHNGGENGQNLYLWSANQNNENQQWIEIDRGNGYYSYQKMGTDYCIDGNGGGAEGQNVYLWACSDNNQNQHWKKVSTAGGSFRLEKRNSPSYSLDGNRGGENEQNVYLWNSDNNNQNQQWLITPIGSAKSLPSVGVTDDVIVYPNPVVNTATIQGAANTIISIYDISGQQLLVKEIATDNEELDLSALPTGIYYGQVVGALSISAIKIMKK